MLRTILLYYVLLVFINYFTTRRLYRCLNAYVFFERVLRLSWYAVGVCKHRRPVRIISCPGGAARRVAVVNTRIYYCCPSQTVGVRE